MIERSGKRSSTLNWEFPTDQGIVWAKNQILPSPHKEIAHCEYDVKWLGADSLVGIAFGQVFIGKNSHDTELFKDLLWSVHYYWFHQIGLALADYYSPHANLEGYPGTYLDGYYIRYFTIGCQHVHLDVKNTGNCQHEMTCLDCGFTYQTDSSD
jgi:hypothetical protein